jgi:hypothetical protein
MPSFLLDLERHPEQSTLGVSRIVRKNPAHRDWVRTTGPVRTERLLQSLLPRQMAGSGMRHFTLHRVPR